MYIVEGDGRPTYEHQLEWLLLCKATAQGYGQVLNTILQQTLELNEHTWYWDDIVSSPRWASVYSLQTSPLRLWHWTQGVILDVRSKNENGTLGLSEGWRSFYGLVRETVRQRSLVDLQARVVSPLAQVRNEARQKTKELKRLKDINANALGVLLGEGLSSMEDAVYSSGSTSDRETLVVTERRDHVVRSIVLMESVLSQVGEPDIDVDTFEDRISAATAQNTWISSLENGYSAGDLRPSEVSSRLQSLLNATLPKYTTSFHTRLSQVGRPSRLIRYWLPATVLVLSSTTILRIVVNRKAELLQWVQELGGTIRDFWINWVVEPTKRILGTIRHDEGSEVAIMSKRSLEGDRESLERMVVDFVRDAPENGTMSEAQLQDVRLKIREGDLTPVLKAYERDMQKPVLGALRGNLIRALLIQVQKTKVDVEVAMGGIDTLLKSQELVFG
jgi:nuclear-control-of-ATPase protein 2